MNLPVGDEHIVNTAAIDLLNGLFVHDKRPADWALQRKQFKFRSEDVTFEAHTDSRLQVHDHETAIIEVKPRVRKYQICLRI
jgi:hypothetical protein